MGVKGITLDSTYAGARSPQQSNLIGTRGFKNGWVRVRRTGGAGLWAAYSVINDGGAPQQKTDDGAFVPMTR